MPNSPGSEPTWDDELSRLIRHGRDREAAELAARRLSSHAQGALMDPRDQLDDILPRLKALVAPLTEAQLDQPTACDKFAIRDVLDHMIGGATMFAAAFRGEAPGPAPATTDLVPAFAPAMDELRAAVRSPGALERTIAAPFGDVPGDVFARFVAMDGLVHGWDIATASGQSYDPPAEVVATVDAFTRLAISDDMRDGERFGARVEAPAGSSALVQLVAFTGRRV